MDKEKIAEHIMDLDLKAKEVDIGEKYVTFNLGYKRICEPFKKVAYALGEYTIPGVAGLLGRVRSIRNPFDYSGKEDQD